MARLEARREFTFSFRFGFSRETVVNLALFKGLRFFDFSVIQVPKGLPPCSIFLNPQAPAYFRRFTGQRVESSHYCPPFHSISLFYLRNLNGPRRNSPQISVPTLGTIQGGVVLTRHAKIVFAIRGTLVMQNHKRTFSQFAFFFGHPNNHALILLQFVVSWAIETVRPLCATLR